MKSQSIALRFFSKILCFSVFLLIFLGALVKSTESGLSVPDWPTTYGHFMFAFPLDQMVGGIKYEHTHRMVASIIGFLTLILCLWLWRSSVSLWLKRLGLIAFLAVVLQGILGGLTVKYFLPVWLSTMHGVLAQTFLLIVAMIAYALSVEYKNRKRVNDAVNGDGQWIRFLLIFLGMVYIQLFLGNWMRHTEAGLAIPDFPTMGGSLIPTMNQAMVDHINVWRFENNLEPVTKAQIHIHFLHRLWALLILLKLIYINKLAYDKHLNNPLIMKTLFWLNIAIGIQIMLGISTVLFLKEIIVTTLHVSCGALILFFSFILLLRSSPCSWQGFMQRLKSR